MTTFDWAYVKRLNLVVLGVGTIAFVILTISPLLHGILMALTAWKYKEIDEWIDLNPTYLDKFNGHERELQDAKNRRIAQWALGALAVVHILRGLSSPMHSIGQGPVNLWVPGLATVSVIILINALELLRYRLALKAVTYEQLCMEYKSMSKLITLPFIVAIWAGIYWFVRTRG